MAGFLILDGTPHAVALVRTSEGYRLRDGPEAPAAIAAVDGDDLWVHLDGQVHHLRWQDEVAHHSAEGRGSSDDCARAPMPGLVIQVSVAGGQPVSAGETMMIIESMKLELAIKAPRAGVVDTVHVAFGEAIGRDAALVTLRPEDA